MRLSSNLFYCSHEAMLISFIETLNLVDEFFVFLALHTDGDGQSAHDEKGMDVVVLGDGLQVGDIEAPSGFLKDIGEVLGHQAVEFLEGGESDDPAVRRGPCCLEVARISVNGGKPEKDEARGEETYAMARTSESAAPSLRSAGAVTGCERVKVAKKWKKALSSFSSSESIEAKYREARDVTSLLDVTCSLPPHPGLALCRLCLPRPARPLGVCLLLSFSSSPADSPLASATTLAACARPLSSVTSKTVSTGSPPTTFVSSQSNLSPRTAESLSSLATRHPTSP